MPDIKIEYNPERDNKYFPPIRTWFSEELLSSAVGESIIENEFRQLIRMAVERRPQVQRQDVAGAER